MWKVHREARVAVTVLAALAALAAFSVESLAQDTFISQNISGFNLPGVVLPQGHDEVRAADGTTCRSAVSGSGAYVDVGVIGNPEQTTYSDRSFSAYGRIVIPIGKKSARLDCSLLYDLEVQRLSMELKLMQMGLNRGISPMTDAVPTKDNWEKLADSNSGDGDNPVKLAARNKDDDWGDDGWSTKGLSQ